MLQWQPVLLDHVSCWQPAPALDTCSGGSLWGHSYAVNLVQHESILPLKSSAVSSLLVPSAPLRLGSDRLNAKPRARMDSSPFSLPCPHADPTLHGSSGKEMHWRRGQEHSSSPWLCKLGWMVWQHNKNTGTRTLTSLLVRLKTNLFVYFALYSGSSLVMFIVGSKWVTLNSH